MNSALAEAVAIVHIPVTQSADYSTKLYWTINRATDESAEFFNITSNQVEVSHSLVADNVELPSCQIAIFAPLSMVVDEWCERDPHVRVNAAWRVFEISSGDEGDTANYGECYHRGSS